MNPDYYNNRRYQPVHVIREWNLNFNLGNVIKYVMRAGHKPGNPAIEDLQKARDYIDFELETLKAEETNRLKSKRNDQ